MAVHRIKAKDDNAKDKHKSKDIDEPVTKVAKVVSKDKKDAKKSDNKVKDKRKAEEKKLKAKEKASRPKRRIPVISYIADSFREIRQVRWPNRKETWKLTFTVIIYVAIVAGFIMLLDAGLTWVFNRILTLGN